MPYTKQHRRRHIIKLLKELEPYIEDKGDLNFTICHLTGNLILRSGISYEKISNWINGVENAGVELTRRILFPYEDTKIEENGDVEPMEKINAILAKKSV